MFISIFRTVFRCLFDSSFRKAVKTARGFLQEQHPDWEVNEALLRADEPERWVFAVFYEMPVQRTRPSPYQLVIVDKKTNEFGEVEPEPDSPYWIRGRK